MGKSPLDFCGRSVWDASCCRWLGGTSILYWLWVVVFGAVCCQHLRLSFVHGIYPHCFGVDFCHQLFIRGMYVVCRSLLVLFLGVWIFPVCFVVCVFPTSLFAMRNLLVGMNYTGVLSVHWKCPACFPNSRWVSPSAISHVVLGLPEIKEIRCTLFFQGYRWWLLPLSDLVFLVCPTILPKPYVVHWQILSTISVAEIPTATSLDVGTINYKWINNLSLMSIDHELSI